MILIFMIGIACSLTISLRWNNERVSIDLAIVDGKALLLYNEMIYENEQEAGWKVVQSEEKVKQLVSGESLSFLDANGKLYFDEVFFANKGEMPLGSAYHVHMLEQALLYNEKQPFLMLNEDILGDFLALLDNNVILYPCYDKYESYFVEKDVTMISGNFILTTDGNVYQLLLNEEKVYDLNSTEQESIIVPQMKPVYEAGDVISIDASLSSNRCIGLTKEGRAIIWSEISYPDISKWNDLVKVEHGFELAAGLTQDGKVVCEYYQKGKSVNKDEINKWKDIIDIEIYLDIIYAIDKEGRLYYL